MNSRLGVKYALGGSGRTYQKSLFKDIEPEWVEVNVVLPTKTGREIRRRCVSRPTDHQAISLQRLGLRLPPNLPLIDKKLKALTLSFRVSGWLQASGS